MSGRLTLLLCSVAIVAAGCSRDPEKTVMATSPTAPTAAVASVASLTGAVRGPDLGLTATIGTRPEILAFRRALDTKY